MATTNELLHMVEDINTTTNKATTEQRENLIDFADQIKSMAQGDDLTKPFLSLLTLPDDEFEVIAPFILLQSNKDLHDSNNQLLMLQTFNANGIRLEDYLSEINALIDEINNMEQLSQAKRDFMRQLLMDLSNAMSEIHGIPKRIINIPIELCHEDAKIPCYANPTDSGMDVYALEDITIAPGETKLIPTGLKVAIPVGYELQVRPKSGRSLKTKLRVANTPGTIDAGYRDEVGVIIDNIDPPIKKIYMNDNGTIAAIDYGSSFTIGKGEKFAQLVLCQISHCVFEQISSVSAVPNDGRNGGYGSTGLK